MSDELTLKPCPFCGGEAVKKFIGNAHTKRRGVTIECGTFGCQAQQRVFALRYDHAWCDRLVAQHWNRRAPCAECEKMAGALFDLLNACYLADAQEELPECVDGTLLDAAKKALAATDAGKKPKGEGR